MRKLMIAGAVATIAVAAPASAQTITFVNGTYSNPPGINAVIFEEFEGGLPGTQYNPATQSSGQKPESVSGSVLSAQGNVPGDFVTPDPDGNEYLAVQAGGAFNVTLGAGTTVFSFVFGSLDSYNSLQLFFSDGSNRLFTGQQIVGGPFPVANPVTTGETGRVTYDVGSGPTITSATFRSAGFDAFEIDALASAVPEPATWGLMILGFGMIGGQLRSRRNAKTTVSFA